MGRLAAPTRLRLRLSHPPQMGREKVGLHLAVSEDVLKQRRAAMEAKGEKAWQPAEPRQRIVSKALQAYGLMATSAAKGAVRDPSQLKRR